jgi:hypothetical protein
VIPKYFEQNQAEALDLDKSVFDTVQEIVPDWKMEQVRTLLGQFLFSGDMVFKQVGPERGRKGSVSDGGHAGTTRQFVDSGRADESSSTFPLRKR